MNNPNDTASSVAAPDAVAPSRARRRLLLGATSALPSVLTLSSGALAAVASSTSCLAPPKTMPPRFTSQDDTWVRAQVRVGELHGQPAYCIASPQNACVDPMVPNHAAPGTQWVVGGNTMTAGMQSDLHIIDDQARAYGLVYVDRTGSVTTLDTHGGINLTPVTDSCWTSLLGGRFTHLG